MGKGDRRGKRGRPRKDGPRYDNGRLKPQKATLADLETLERAAHELSPAQETLKVLRRHQTGEDSDRPVSPEEAKHLIDCNTELGRLCFGEKLITEAQLNAGVAYAETVRRFRQVHGLPKETAQTLSWGEVRGGGAPPTPEAIKAAAAAYSAAQAKLQPLGPSVAAAVSRACVHNQRTTTHLVVLGLAALAGENPENLHKGVDT